MAASKLRLVTDNSKKEPAKAEVLFGRYVVLDEIRGKNATIYHCIDRTTTKEVAVKEVAVSNGFKSVEMLEREYRAGTNMEHPNLLAYNESLEEKGRCYLVREWAKGESVQEILDKDRRLTGKEIDRIMGGVIEAVEYMHSFNPPYIHRDIKPGNIIVGDDEVKLTDLGAVTAVRSKGTTSSFGTHGFFALDAIANPTTKSDVFALGATLLYMKTRQTADDILSGSGEYEIPPWIEGKHRRILEGTLQTVPNKRINLTTMKALLAGEQAIVRVADQQLAERSEMGISGRIADWVLNRLPTWNVAYWTSYKGWMELCNYLVAQYWPTVLMSRKFAAAIYDSPYREKLSEKRQMALLRRAPAITVVNNLLKSGEVSPDESWGLLVDPTKDPNDFPNRIRSLQLNEGIAKEKHGLLTEYVERELEMAVDMYWSGHEIEDIFGKNAPEESKQELRETIRATILKVHKRAEIEMFEDAVWKIRFERYGEACRALDKEMQKAIADSGAQRSLSTNMEMLGSELIDDEFAEFTLVRNIELKVAMKDKLYETELQELERILNSEKLSEKAQQKLGYLLADEGVHIFLEIERGILEAEPKLIETALNEAIPDYSYQSVLALIKSGVVTDERSLEILNEWINDLKNFP